MKNKLSLINTVAGLGVLSMLMTACGSNTNRNSANVIDETYVHKYGVAVPSDYWQASGSDGAVVSTMDDGVVVTRRYSRGNLEGDTTYTYPHSSQIQESETYSNGTVVKETEFFFDGTPKIETVYDQYEPGSKVISTWYLTGTPRSIERYRQEMLVNGEYFTSTNQRDALVDQSQGTRLTRDDYGQLIATDTIANGQMVQRVLYHPNGSPREIIPYNNNAIEGTKRTFLPAGEPSTVEQWVGGQQEGMTVVFQHGEKFAEVPYYNGDKNGVETRYRDGNTKVQEISWNAGKMHGPTTTYAGDVAKTDWYFKGKQTTKADFDFMSNKPVAR